MADGGHSETVVVQALGGSQGSSGGGVLAAPPASSAALPATPLPSSVLTLDWCVSLGGTGSPSTHSDRDGAGSDQL